MTIQKLASEIAKREGKKSQARIGDIREILGILSDVAVEDMRVLYSLVVNGCRRRKKAKKK
jgi:hypothetical protein